MFLPLCEYRKKHKLPFLRHSWELKSNLKFSKMSFTNPKTINHQPYRAVWPQSSSNLSQTTRDDNDDVTIVSNKKKKINKIINLTKRLGHSHVYRSVVYCFNLIYLTLSKRVYEYKLQDIAKGMRHNDYKNALFHFYQMFIYGELLKVQIYGDSYKR